jgi:hypothetical protein
MGRCWLGRQPRESWRQLEQQCQELPFGESQQEQAGQPEQQPGLPPRQHTKERQAGSGSFRDGPGVPFVSRHLPRSGGGMLPDEERDCRRGRQPRSGVEGGGGNLFALPRRSMGAREGVVDENESLHIWGIFIDRMVLFFADSSSCSGRRSLNNEGKGWKFFCYAERPSGIRSTPIYPWRLP